MQTNRVSPLNESTPTQEVDVKVAPKSSRKAVAFIFVLSLLLALTVVLLGPVFVDGAEVSTVSSTATTAELPEQVDSFETVAEAAAVLGFTPSVPSALPNGYQMAGIYVLDGGILELVYEANQDTLIFRTALGTKDLSLSDEAEHLFSLSDEEGAVIRTYSGESEEKLRMAVWTEGEASFAVVSEEGLSADTLRAISESVG